MKQSTAKSSTATAPKSSGSAAQHQPFFGGREGAAPVSDTENQFFAPAAALGIQAKLTIGAPDDPLEREADAVADQVVQRLAENPSSSSEPPAVAPQNLEAKPIQRLPISSIQRKCDHCEQEEKMGKGEEEEQLVQEKIQLKPIFESGGEPPPDDDSPNLQRKISDGSGGGWGVLQMKCADCAAEEQESVLQKKEVGGGGGETTASADISSRLSASKGGGSPLPADLSASFGGAMGADFSGVRVHTDSGAAGLSRDLGARAFTYGSDVYFGGGEFAPGSSGGRRLLAHELTHVVQQGGNNEIQKKPIIQRACGPNAIGTRSGCAALSGDVTGERFLFNVNCDTLSAGEEYRLRAFALTISGDDTIDIHGFASVDGDAVFNESLSCARAQKATVILRHELSLLGETPTIHLYMHGATEGVRRIQRSVVIDRKVPQATEQDSLEKKCGPDVTEWLIAQMRVNGNGERTREMRRLNNTPVWNLSAKLTATTIWYMLVRTGGEWDFKTILGREVSDRFPECRRNCNGKLWSITLNGVCMTYEVAANIHYGYVGRMAGFSESYLLFGAGGAQVGEGRGESSDDPRDVEAIKVGFNLFDQSDPTAFTATELTSNHYNNLPEGDGDPEACEACESIYS